MPRPASGPWRRSSPARGWGQKYPAIAMSWRRNWQHVVPFFAFPEGVRRIIYTTDEMDKQSLPVA